MMPVNRVRVTRACDRCKKRKIRCTGTQPCDICTQASAQCLYNAPYSRVRPGSTAHWPQPRPAAAAAPAATSPILLEPQTNSRSLAAPQLDVINTNSLIVDGEGGEDDGGGQFGTRSVSRISPEPIQTDRQGHYVGPASGVSFLLRIQKRMHQSVSFTHPSASIFTFGDAPLPDFDPTDFHVMLERSDTTAMVQRFFEFVVPVDRFLHRPTVESWLHEFHSTMGAMHKTDDAPARKAVLFTVFALAQDLMTSAPSPETADLSMRFFMIADHQLSKERGTTRLVSVQARLCQCLWLLSRSRINHCWNLFGTATRLAIAIGLHRKNRDSVISSNMIDTECRRRTFWNAYCLDNYLSMALGRPRTFQDDDIDQDFPSLLDDNELLKPNPTQQVSSGQPVMFASVAYFKIHRIVTLILRDLYSIQPLSAEDRLVLAVDYSSRLKSWRSMVSRFVDMDKSLLMPIFQRQHNVLNLTYWHVMILNHRPFLLSNFARLQGNRKSGGDDQQREAQVDQNILECLEAATRIVQTLDEMVQAKQLFLAYWFTCYAAFSATVILYVYVIQQSASESTTYAQYLEIATQCQKQLADVAEPGSLVSRYCMILEELRTEVYNSIARSSPLSANNYEGDPRQVPNGDMMDMGTSMAPPNENGDASIDAIGFHLNPSPSLADLVGWAQFDSLAATEFGSFGGPLKNYQFGIQ